MRSFGSPGRESGAWRARAAVQPPWSRIGGGREEVGTFGLLGGP